MGEKKMDGAVRETPTHTKTSHFATNKTEMKSLLPVLILILSLTLPPVCGGQDDGGAHDDDSRFLVGTGIYDM